MEPGASWTLRTPPVDHTVSASAPSVGRASSSLTTLSSLVGIVDVGAATLMAAGPPRTPRWWAGQATTTGDRGQDTTAVDACHGNNNNGNNGNNGAAN